jgi:hypothetical protein
MFKSKSRFLSQLLAVPRSRSGACQLIVQPDVEASSDARLMAIDFVFNKSLSATKDLEFSRPMKESGLMEETKGIDDGSRWT